MTLSDAAADNFAPMLPIDPFPCLGSYFLIAPIGSARRNKAAAPDRSPQRGSLAEEPRCHVHVFCPDGEAKFWLDPEIELAQNYGMNDWQLRATQRLIEEHQDGIRDIWRKHFPS